MSASTPSGTAATKGATFRTVDGKEIRWTDKTGLVHICEGADVHPGVRLIWTLCERDVPAGKAWKLDKPSVHEICITCSRRAALSKAGGDL